MKNIKNRQELQEFQIEITKDCSLRCLHCSSNFSVNDDNYQIDFCVLQSFFKSLRQSSFIYLTGGEPLLVNDLSERIFELASISKDISIGMYSSGILIKNCMHTSVSVDEALRLKSAGLSECYFSIYDSIKFNHDAITQIPGSFEKTSQSINNFNRAGICTKAHIVINRYSCNHIYDVIRSTEALGVQEIRILSLVKSGRAISNWDEIGLDSSEQNKILMSIYTDRDIFNCRLTFSGIPEIIACRPLNVCDGCVAGEKLHYITIYGDIFPCACTRHKKQYMLGNIKSLVFEDIHSTKINKGGCLNAQT